MAWFSLRDSLLHLVTTPVLLLPLIAALALALCAAAGLRWPVTALLSGLVVALVSFVYSPLTTAALTAWLSSQLPQPPPPVPGPALAVLVGRSPEIAAASTALAARLLQQGRIQAIYVSGDGPATAQRLLDLGVPPQRIAGDSCARTTWENAGLTSTWIRAHHNAAELPAILLITDPWQLPRASRAFQRQQLPVTPIPAVPVLPPLQSNRLALRESAATVLYGLQGRM
ncbi:YdcF family protein [Cyanobium sp. AMD-g]|uniref:YdcF family protein n=1 Tax=Cyanobium sp. AMD-g TaxID=2823699 RepID=UPI0020CD2FFD|nr:YdcF family protein [Cyanobium sp. AMD-g]MCP9929756.1 YdcF family protein [Cyanobium sp. AMD-g]